MAKQNYQRAFTMLEMLVALLTIGIVAAIAIPNFKKFVLRSRVATMFEAASAAQFVVTNDYYNNGQVLVNINYDGNSYNSVVAALLPQAKSAYINAVNGITVTSGVITVTGVAAKLFANQINLTLTPLVDATTQQISWQCCVANTALNDLVPPYCRC